MFFLKKKKISRFPALRTYSRKKIITLSGLHASVAGSRVGTTTTPWQGRWCDTRALLAKLCQIRPMVDLAAIRMVPLRECAIKREGERHNVSSYLQNHPPPNNPQNRLKRFNLNH